MAKLARFSALHQPAQKVKKRRVVVVVAPPPAPSGDFVGTMTVGGPASGQYGYGTISPVMGSMTQNPAGMLDGIIYNAGGGTILFKTGSYSGPNGSFTISFGSFGGSNIIDVTIDGITERIVFDGMTWSDPGSDTFGLIGKVGQTLNVSITKVT